MDAVRKECTLVIHVQRLFFIDFWYFKKRLGWKRKFFQTSWNPKVLVICDVFAEVGITWALTNDTHVQSSSFHLEGLSNNSASCFPHGKLIVIGIAELNHCRLKARDWWLRPDFSDKQRVSKSRWSVWNYWQRNNILLPPVMAKLSHMVPIQWTLTLHTGKEEVSQYNVLQCQALLVCPTMSSVLSLCNYISWEYIKSVELVQTQNKKAIQRAHIFSRDSVA